MLKETAASACRLFAACYLLFSSLPATAADVWFYEWRDPPSANRVWTQPLIDNNKHWVLTEFDHDPYPGQLRAMHDLGNAQKISLVFKLSPSPALAGEYSALVRTWKTQGIESQLKFVGTLPTEQEARILLPVCELGTKIVFITNQVPTPYEAGNLQLLKNCVEIDFALNRYPKYADLKDFKALEGLPLVFVNNYFPAYAHVDTLNLIDTPISLRVTDSIASSEQIALLNYVKRLAGFTWELNLFPMDEQYALYSKLERGPTRKFGLRWAFGPPRDQDIDAWVRLRPGRLQISAEVFAQPGAERRLRQLDGEIIVETFQLQQHQRRLKSELEQVAISFQ